MPITTKHGSIFDSTAQVLVCPVNCVGVMGKGLALDFKRRFAQECEGYFMVCRTNAMGPGGVLRKGRVVFAATKDHWRHPSNLTYVEHCLINIAGWLHGEITWECDSIAIPQLGCGCGGLDWKDVSHCTRNTWSGWTATWRSGSMSEFDLTMKDFELLTSGSSCTSSWFCQLKYGDVYLDRYEARSWQVTIYWKGAKIEQPHRSRRACIEAIPKLMRAFE